MAAESSASGALAPSQVDDRVVKEAVRSFAAMDQNGDGQLSLPEFRSGLGTLGMDPEFSTILFNSFDRDGDGTIDRKEFIASMAVMLHPTDQQQQVALAFEAYDLNKDGKIEPEELRRVIASIFATMEKMGIRDESGEPDHAARTADELYAQLDADGKGYVTKEDYQRLALANPELVKKIGLGGVVNPRQASRSADAAGRASKAKVNTPGSAAELSRAGSLRSKKRGTTVSFGHENWELVVQMMLAIRLSVGRALNASREQLGHSPHASGRQPPAGGSFASREGRVPDVKLRPAMFTDVWRTRIPGHRRGKDTTIGFKDYAPLVFRRIRSLFGVSDREYMLSLGPEQILGELLLGTMGSLSELFSEGKSGSFFYFSNDGRYLIKTIPHRELTSLVRLLPQYVDHCEAQPHTLLPRFMGAHRLVLPQSRSKVHFIVMTNVFSTSLSIHERYDLKGSTLGRTAGAKKLAKNPDMVRKDNDLPSPFLVAPVCKEQLAKQVERDLDFLRLVKTMDYSLLVGVHYPDRELAAPGSASAAATPTGEPATPAGEPATPADEPATPADEPATPTDEPATPADAPAGVDSELTAPPRTPRDLAPPSWVDSEDGSIVRCGEGAAAVYFIGVIDILTAWSAAKSVENIVKTMVNLHQPNAVSCVPPHRYANRFQRAMPKWLDATNGSSPAAEDVVEAARV